MTQRETITIVNIKRQITNALSIRTQQVEISEQATDATDFTPPRVDIPHKSSFHIRELTRYSGVDFISAVYQALLERAPDKVGFEHHRHLLHTGKLTRTEFIRQVMLSPEGRKFQKRVTGLSWRLIIRRAMNRRPFSWLTRIFLSRRQSLATTNYLEARIADIQKAIDAIRATQTNVVAAEERIDSISETLRIELNKVTQDFATELTKCNLALRKQEQKTGRYREMHKQSQKMILDLSERIQRATGSPSTEEDDHFYHVYHDHFVSEEYTETTAARYQLLLTSELKELDSERSFFLDIGCGKGILLRELSAVGFPSVGIDSNPSFVRHCVDCGYTAHTEDALRYVRKLDDNTLTGASMLQVIEHLDFSYARDLVITLNKKIMKGGILLIETVNPYSLTTLSRFWLDFTHKFPLVPELTKFLLEYAGFKNCEIHLINKQPQESALSSVRFDGEPIEDVLYGYSDYYVIGRRV